MVWEGNVRELENVIHRFVVLSTAILKFQFLIVLILRLMCQNIPSGTLEEVELAIIRNRLMNMKGIKQRRLNPLVYPVLPYGKN